MLCFCLDFLGISQCGTFLSCNKKWYTFIYSCSMLCLGDQQPERVICLPHFLITWSSNGKYCKWKAAEESKAVMACKNKEMRDVRSINDNCNEQLIVRAGSQWILVHAMKDLLACFFFSFIWKWNWKYFVLVGNDQEQKGISKFTFFFNQQWKAVITSCFCVLWICYASVYSDATVSQLIWKGKYNTCKI